MGMSISGFHFGSTITAEISESERDNDPLDFYADIRVSHHAFESTVVFRVCTVLP